MSRVRGPYARFCERDKYRTSILFYIYPTRCYWPPRQPCSETSELVLLGQAKSTIMRSIGFICKTSAL